MAGDNGNKQNGTSFDLNDFTIIKEGDAEILMHAKNEVFYNNSQVLLFSFFSDSYASYESAYLVTYLPKPYCKN